MNPNHCTHRKIQKPLLAVLGLFFLAGYDSCGQDLLDNSGFDLWCGEELCSWEVEEGAVEPVATWHARDRAAALVGEAVAISQLSPITQQDARCILFTLQGNADADASLSLELDFLDDGTVDLALPIAVEDWQTSSVHIQPPAWYEGVRFRLRKRGGGDAVIAQIRAQAEGEDRCGDVVVTLTDLPAGAPCEGDESCADGSCAEVAVLSSELNDAGESWEQATCGECAGHDDCEADEACGMGAGSQEYSHLECGPAGRHQLGEHCAFDKECGTGVCCEGQCSECCAGEGCADGQSCARKAPEGEASGADAPAGILPFMCDAGSAARTAGEACLGDLDCASGDCASDALLSVCDPDGRRCETDSDCPWADWIASCVTLGAEAGTCQGG